MRNFFYGVIEGFYGRQWSWTDREQYAVFLAQHGFDCYIYAPKGDHRLRSDWRTQHCASDIQRLSHLRLRYQDAGIRWGIGLSPLGLTQQYNVEDCNQLKKKIRAINEFSPDILCILFDDTRGDIDDLATRQLQITNDIMAVSCAKHHIVCPTYYSFDPVLDNVFGKMPESYLETLGQGLDDDVDIFWTGNYVISQHYAQADLESVTRLLNRRPILWDNYPANDGKLTSNYLYLKPYTGRPYQLKHWSSGHIVNPMNQANLSTLVLQSLQKVYQLNDNYDVAAALSSGLGRLTSKSLAKNIEQDWVLFQEQGLAALTLSQREHLKTRYESFNEPLALEIVDWLNEGYQFDPQCLTD